MEFSGSEELVALWVKCKGIGSTEMARCIDGSATMIKSVFLFYSTMLLGMGNSCEVCRDRSASLFMGNPIITTVQLHQLRIASSVSPADVRYFRALQILSLYRQTKCWFEQVNHYYQEFLNKSENSLTEHDACALDEVLLKTKRLNTLAATLCSSEAHYMQVIKDTDRLFFRKRQYIDELSMYCKMYGAYQNNFDGYLMILCNKYSA